MKEQILSPGVQDRREADLGAEPLGIGRQRQEAVPNHSQRGFQEEFLHHSAAFSSMTAPPVQGCNGPTIFRRTRVQWFLPRN